MATTGEFGDNGIDGCGPDERLRAFVPGCQKFVDGGDEVPDVQEGIAADALVSGLLSSRALRPRGKRPVLIPRLRYARSDQLTGRES